MKPARIAVLALLVAALGGYLYWVELPAARQEAEMTKLVSVDADAITGITLDFPDRQMVLVKTDGTWRLTKPVDAPADDAMVKTLVSALTGAQITRTLDEVPTDLASFGLDRGDPVVTLQTASGPLPPILLGKNLSIGGKTYVRIGNDGKVALTASTLKVGLNKQTKDLRDKQILTFQDDQVLRIDIQAAQGAPIALVRKDKNAPWRIEPGDLPADPTEVRSYLSSLRSTRAVDFPADVTPDTTGLATPGLSVTVTTSADGAQKQTLLVGNAFTEGTQKQLYAQRVDQPTIYAVGDWAPRTLAKDAAALRDKLVLAFSPESVGRVVLERREGAGATLVQSPGGKWKAENAGDQPTKEGVATRFLDDLRDLRGAAIAAEPAGDLKPFGLDAPDLRITLLDRDSKPIGTALASQRDGKYFAMREGGTTVFEVRDYMFTRLDKKGPDFVGPDLAPAPPPANDDAEPEPDDGE
ncbi:MAG TPA: DUF4340 domain-containing protein [Candidatus Binatia bacterium]|nr:DUF4340 domain-containing protein [Candidatus Binatia bacterium]